jgi:hypothetical protein
MSFEIGWHHVFGPNRETPDSLTWLEWRRQAAGQHIEGGKQGGGIVVV